MDNDNGIMDNGDPVLLTAAASVAASNFAWKRRYFPRLVIQDADDDHHHHRQYEENGAVALFERQTVDAHWQLRYVGGGGHCWRQ